MKAKNPFDAKREASDRNPKMLEGLTDAALDAVDTLELVWTAAQSVFDKQATPHLALEIYDRIDAALRRIGYPKGVGLRATS